MAYVLLLFLAEVVLFATNYHPGTFLLGWDNIMPEFNFPLNFERAIFSVWQEYRGLGLLDGMAHAANLFHTFYLFLLSLVLPTSSLRYVFIFLTHLVGGIGFFFLAKNLTGRKKSSFLGALFYMFNLGVIQMYYAPLEVFASHFAALPILTLLTIKTLNNFNKKNLLFLFLAGLLTSPQGFVPTVFLSFLILFSSLVLFDFLKNKDIKKSILIAFIIFSANAFWLLPYSFSALKNSGIIQNTRINQFSSEEIYYRNKAFGDVFNVLSFKGFMIDSIEYDQRTNNNAYIMNAWRNHSNSIIYKFLFSILVFITLGGLFFIFYKRKKEYYPFALAFLIVFVFLANKTPLFDQLNSAIRFLFPALGEALRFPFTKFVILFAFCFSIFLTLGLTKVLYFLKRYEKFVFFSFVLALIYLSFPAFKGNFIYPLLKVNLPKDYLETFEYFNNIDQDQRVAFFPVSAFWNWQYRSWGHRGSGFLWYGIKQPILERAFDPWSLQNEQFYNEIFYAVNTEDYELFKKVIAKFDIRYILLDQSIQNISFPNPIDYTRVKRFIEKDNFISKEAEFGKIIIFKTQLSNSWIYSLVKDTPKTSSSFISESKDSLISDFSSYIVAKEESNIVLPFPSLSSLKSQKDLEFEVKDEPETITFISKQKPQKNNNYLLELPSLFNSEFLIPINAEFINGKIYISPIYPKIFINNKEIEINNQPLVINPSSVKNPKSIVFEDVPMESFFPKAKGYLLKGYPNVIKIKDDLIEEKIIIDTSSLIKISSFIPINEEVREIKMQVEKINSPFSIERVIENGAYEIKSPNKSKKGSLASVVKGFNSVNFEIKGTSKELVFYKDSLPHQASYILLAETNYESGLPIIFYIDNSFENRPELETRLSKKDGLNAILLPKTEEYFKGYGFHFIVKSEASELAKSSIGRISIYPFPMETIKRIRITENNLPLASSEKKFLGFNKLGNFIYKTGMPDSGYIVLSQSYNEGWKAYQINSQFSIFNFQLAEIFPFFFGKELKDHVLVNNWENGWKIDNYTLDANNYTLVIIYWPQYLEFLGFFLLVVSFVFIIVRPIKKSH